MVIVLSDDEIDDPEMYERPKHSEDGIGQNGILIGNGSQMMMNGESRESVFEKELNATTEKLRMTTTNTDLALQNRLIEKLLPEDGVKDVATPLLQPTDVGRSKHSPNASVEDDDNECEDMDVD
ncbi:hypothetical protein KC19_2G086900 [Ceratodon purpureus]|uniref:Uncharacterized protein n=1 Tax=Ceratodon purpureus TaxID=3225 RepID=A0A8T0ITS4_CERPU|nr:hypothetical protein KC19_2G086900 [Ceratodon purpureus]